MATAEFIESDLRFKFGDQWIIKKFDAHRYYVWLSGRGLKGVDFIGIYQQKKVVLIEVKNFSRRNDNQKPEHLQVDADKLSEAFIHKIEDTLQVIMTASVYTSSRLLFPFRSYFAKWFPNLFSRQKDWLFWTTMQQLIDNNNANIHFILWLEEAKNDLGNSGKNKADISFRVKHAFREYSAQVEILNRSMNNDWDLVVEKIDQDQASE